MMKSWDEVWPLVGPIQGWLGQAQARILFDLARTAHTVVELGAWKGRSTAALGFGVPPGGAVWTVDGFHGSADERIPGGPQAEVLGLVGGTLPEFARVMDALGLLGDPVRVIVADHVEAAAAFRLPVDLLFIDGEHTTEATAAAFRAWSPHLSPEAVVVFHDLQFTTVRTAIEQVLGLHVEEAWSMAIWRRP